MLLPNRTLLFTSTIAFSSFFIAIFYQHYFDMDPCFKCIQQRSFLLLSGFLAFFSWVILTSSNPNHRSAYIVKSILSFTLAFMGAYSASAAYHVAKDHLSAAHSEFSFLFSTCSTNSPLPEWLPLDVWIPDLFAATGECSGDIAKAFGIEMPVIVQGISLIFVTLIFCFIIMQFKVVFRNR
jgi:disulfide bond formation protein DsbB